MKQDKQVILIAEDHEMNRRLLVTILGKDYDIIEATDGQKAIEILEQSREKISGILLDILMPVKNGYDVLEYLDKNGMKNIPVVVMTGETDKESEVKALDCGAWDFVSKPYQPKILKTRLKNAIDKSKLTYLSNMKHFAEHSQLTGLYNRRHFFEVTDSKIEELAENESAAFIRMDINRFRLVNAFWGEGRGDELLKYIANEIKKIAVHHKWHSYGHIESDVFAFFVPLKEKRQEEQCALIYEYFTKKLVEYSNSYTIEPAFGVYIMQKGNPAQVDAEKMYQYTTIAARVSKERNLPSHICFYDEKLDEQTTTEHEIMQEMQKALDNEEFLVYFQPKYNTKTKTPYGAEALVRWKHPEKGMISPGVFIPIFEKSGFIGKLDHYVWEQVCRYIRKWIDMGIDVAPISVNMSRAELSNPNLVDIITNTTKRFKIPPHLFNLELTESAYMDNPEAIRGIIDKLHHEGFQVFIDDFGSGYSSLNTLKDIEADVLKIDMKFLSLDEKDIKSKKILASVIYMARWIGLPVITEGVETEAQYVFLDKMDCEYIQGYYFAKPMSAEEYELLIMNNDATEADSKSDAGEFFVKSGI